MTVSLQKVRIERIVTNRSWRTGKFKATAEFQLDDGFFLCRAYPDRTDNTIHHIQIREVAENCEVAGQVCIAIQMAIDWIAEQEQNALAKPADLGDAGAA